MKYIYTLITMAIILSGCSTMYKAAQTPDDVYYSPAPAVAEREVRTENEYSNGRAAQPEKDNKYYSQRNSNNNYNNYNSYYNDYSDYNSNNFYTERFIRYRMNNRYRWGVFDDYYFNDRYPYCYAGAIDIWHSPYNNYYNWYGSYNPYNYGGSVGYYTPGCNSGWNSNNITIVNHTYNSSNPVVPRYSTFNPNSYNTSSRSSIMRNNSNGRQASESGGNGFQGYNNSNSGSSSRGRAATSNNSTNNSSRASSSSSSSSSNTSSTPTRTYNPSSSNSGSSSSGSSNSGSSNTSSGGNSGGTKTRPPR